MGQDAERIALSRMSERPCERFSGFSTALVHFGKDNLAHWNVPCFLYHFDLPGSCCSRPPKKAVELYASPGINSIYAYAHVHAKLFYSSMLQSSKVAQLLGCLNWLQEFHILACIPNHENSSFEDVAELANVPRVDLAKVVRLTATAGILKEPEPGYVAHSALSAQLLQRPSLLEVVSLLTKDIVPAILDMPEASRRRVSTCSGKTDDDRSKPTWLERSETDPRFKRRLAALHRWQSNLALHGVATAILSLDWAKLGRNTLVVEVNAQNTALAKALLDHHPDLQVISQLQLAQRREASSGKLNVQMRQLGTSQPVRSAAVYILRLSPPSPAIETHILRSQIVTELRIHFNLLLNNPTTILLVVISLPQDSSQVDADIHAFAQTQDLWQFQMTNERTLDTAELVSLIHSTQDAKHHLVISRRLSGRRDHDAVFQVHVRPHADAGTSWNLCLN
nr:trypacidin cluster transcriptional coactivator tpcd [Quercus suber]